MVNKYKGLHFWFTMNAKIIATINKCDRASYVELFDEILSIPVKDRSKIFTSTRYIWGVLRGKDFYKMVAFYVVDSLQSKEQIRIDRAEYMIDMVMDSKEYMVKRAFMKNILKDVSIMTIKTLPYTSPERINRMLTDVDGVFNDEITEIILNYVTDLHQKVNALNEMID